MGDACHPPAGHGVGLSDDRGGAEDKGEGQSWGWEPVSHPTQRVLNAWLAESVFH